MIKNIHILIVLINYKIAAVTSASADTDADATTETASTAVILKSDKAEDFSISTENVKFATEGLEITEKPKFPSQSLILDDIERKLMDIFEVTFSPISLTTFAPDAFNSVEMEAMVHGKKLGLSRRTNFRTRLNCRCVIHNRCARSESCLKTSNEE